MSTNVERFIADLDGGVFEQKLSHILSDVAGAVVDHGKKGQVIIKMDITQIGSSHQVAIAHTLQYKRPTSKGTASEDETTATPMHVGKKGALTFFPEKQIGLFDEDSLGENVKKLPSKNN